MSVATFKMGFYPLYLKSYEKLTFFQCRQFLIANCSPHGQNPRCVLIVLKSAYPNYPINNVMLFSFI